MTSYESVDDEWERFLEEEYADPTVDLMNAFEDESDLGDAVQTPSTSVAGDDVPKVPLSIHSLNTSLEEAAQRSGSMSFPVVYRGEVPDVSPVNISTKTKFAYLCQPIELDVFWDIPILPYNERGEGVIKKQRLFCSHSAEELEALKEKLKRVSYYDEQINVHIDNAGQSNFAGKKRKRIEFKDTRIITVGTSKNTLLKAETKQKKAFVNCFVLELRMKCGNEFREFHVKVFNSGKLKIPGIKTDAMFDQVVAFMCRTLQPFMPPSCVLSPSEVSDVILTNSNFKCGYYVDMQTFHEILVKKYKVHAVYDTCSSYPGIQCKFKMSADDCNLNNHEVAGVERTTFNSCMKLNKKQKKDTNCITVAIFRTGSVLVSGSCDNHVVYTIHDFLRNVFLNECKHICKKVYTEEEKKLIQVQLESTKSKMIAKKVKRMYVAVTAPTVAPVAESGTGTGGKSALKSKSGFPVLHQALRFIPLEGPEEQDHA